MQALHRRLNCSPSTARRWMEQRGSLSAAPGWHQQHAQAGRTAPLQAEPAAQLVQQQQQQPLGGQVQAAPAQQRLQAAAAATAAATAAAYGDLSSGSDSGSSEDTPPVLVPLKLVVAEAVKRWFNDTLSEARRGDVKQQALLAQMYKEGYGCKVDMEQSRIWAERARLRGYNMQGVYCSAP